MASSPEPGQEVLRLYRLTKRKYARQPLAGIGGLQADGRWHSAGRPVVYLASSEALAVLEVRVHLGSVVPVDPWQLLTFEVPVDKVSTLPRRRWPRQWDAVPFVKASQQFGDRWLASLDALALKVPSVHSASDFNVVLNPLHPDARSVRLVGQHRYAFDGRLFVPTP
jgi:RES domain-containing protein